MPAANRLLLGRCTLDLAAGELLDAEGELAGLRKQALDVLLALGRRAGEVVSKDELMSRCGRRSWWARDRSRRPLPTSGACSATASTG